MSEGKEGLYFVLESSTQSGSGSTIVPLCHAQCRKVVVIRRNCTYSTPGTFKIANKYSTVVVGEYDILHVLYYIHVLMGLWAFHSLPSPLLTPLGGKISHDGRTDTRLNQS
jgi:hypothetical protein